MWKSHDFTTTKPTSFPPDLWQIWPLVNLSWQMHLSLGVTWLVDVLLLKRILPIGKVVYVTTTLPHVNIILLMCIFSTCGVAR